MKHFKLDTYEDVNIQLEHVHHTSWVAVAHSVVGSNRESLPTAHFPGHHQRMFTWLKAFAFASFKQR
jgi:hypothetical protein